MSGENESSQPRLSAEEESKLLDKILDEYEAQIGLKMPANNNTVEEYLNLTEESLRRMNPEDCGVGAALMSQFAFHLQKAINKEIARVNWADGAIKRTIANEISQYVAPSAEERKNLAIRGNERAIKLERIRVNAQARVDRISYLSSKVESIAEKLNSLQQSKRRIHG